MLPPASNTIALPRPLITAEEKQLVFLDWSAERSAKLILLQDAWDMAASRIVAIVEEIVGIQVTVAEELEQRAVESIAARFCHNVHVRTRVTSVAGVVGGSLDFELLDRVRIGNRDADVDARVGRDAGSKGVHNRDTVHLEIVLVDTVAVDSHVESALAERRGVVYAAIGTGLQAQESAYNCGWRAASPVRSPDSPRCRASNSAFARFQLLLRP